MSMPGLNGLDATRVVCREIPHVDVILVSQNNPSIISRMAREVGARASCSKSDLSRDLLPILERTLEVRQRNQPGGTSTHDPETAASEPRVGTDTFVRQAKPKVTAKRRMNVKIGPQS